MPAPLLLPRPANEAASSIARGLEMDCEPVLAARDGFKPGLAYGSVSMRLRPLAEETRGLYGDALALRDRHTLFAYLALSTDAASADALSDYLINGEGHGAQSQLPVFAIMRTGGIRVCPVCEAMHWKRFGVCAFLYPHLPPFVQACAWHGCLLLARCPLPVPPTKLPAPCPAHRDQVAFSQTVLALCEEGGGRAAVVARLRGALIAHQLMDPDGGFCAQAFSTQFARYCAGLQIHPALRKLAMSPRRGRQLMAWVAGQGTVNPAFVALLCMFVNALDAGSVAASASGSFEHAPRATSRPSHPKAWRAKRWRPLPVDGRKRYRRTEIAMLIDCGCTCADIARLCGVSVDTIYRYIRANGLRDSLDDAHTERIRLEAREAWLGRLQSFPDASANQIAQREPRLWRWLREHDEAWLRAHWPPAYRRRPRRRSDATGVRGQGAALAKRIRAAARQLVQAYPAQRRTLAALRRQLGLSGYALAKAAEARQVRDAIDAYLKGAG